MRIQRKLSGPAAAGLLLALVALVAAAFWAEVALIRYVASSVFDHPIGWLPALALAVLASSLTVRGASK